MKTFAKGDKVRYNGGTTPLPFPYVPEGALGTVRSVTGTGAYLVEFEGIHSQFVSPAHLDEAA